MLALVSLLRHFLDVLYYLVSMFLRPYFNGVFTKIVINGSNYSCHGGCSGIPSRWVIDISTHYHQTSFHQLKGRINFM